MLKHKRSRKRIRRLRLLVAAYCCGLSVMVLGTSYLGDGEAFFLAKCKVRRAIGGLQRTDTNSQQNIASLSTCCVVRQPDLQEPVLTAVSLSQAEGSSVKTFCVYGENFGGERRTSVLTVGGAPVSVYREWADPGRPYGPGRLARICGELSRWSRSGEKQVRLTTRNGLSNAMSLRILGSSSETADTSTGPGGRTDIRPNRTAMALLESKGAPTRP